MFVKNQSVNHYLKQFRVFVPVAIILLSLTACNLGITSPSVFNGSGSSGTIDRGTSSGQSSNYIPIAVADEIITDPFNPVAINVLANDYGLGNLPLEITIPNNPQYGNIAISESNEVIFTPNSSFIGVDEFTYMVTDASGYITTALVNIDIRCAKCSNSQLLTLSWDAVSGPLDGYIVYIGPSAEEANTELTRTVNNLVQLDTAFDLLGADLTKTACFRIKAYNSYGSSRYSDAECVSSSAI